MLKGTKNAFYREVGKDVVDAILIKRAEKGQPAEYFKKEEQENKLEAAYEKWSKKGGVWSQAASKVCFTIYVLLVPLARCEYNANTK